jgi:two-component system, response regulator PdtaR
MTALSVLVVEDDAMIGLLLADMLEEMGYHVCGIAATEEDAVASAARCRPGLMIVDQELREGTGVSAVKRILLNGSIPCIFMSGAPDHLAGRSPSVLQKPFVEADLARAIRHLVGSTDAPPPLPAAPGHIVAVNR